MRHFNGQQFQLDMVWGKLIVVVAAVRVSSLSRLGGIMVSQTSTQKFGFYFCVSEVGEDAGFAAIGSLFFCGRPSTIFRFVVLVNVDAVKTVFWRWLSSHISKEV